MLRPKEVVKVIRRDLEREAYIERHERSLIKLYGDALKAWAEKHPQQVKSLVRELAAVVK